MRYNAHSQEKDLRLKKTLDGVPIVSTYKYLGVPLDSALTLNPLVAHLTEKIKKFSRRIDLVSHSIVGTKTRFNLWQTYARCLFDYFSSAMALSGQLNKFERLFTKSLKKTLGLPMQLPNLPLLKAVGTPSLIQIAGHYIINTSALIRERYHQSPASLTELETDLKGSANEYKTIKNPEPVKTTGRNTYLLDLLTSEKAFTRNVLGLATGAFLTLRNTDGKIGTVRKCEFCSQPATQNHFLNDCSGTIELRTGFKQEIVDGVIVPLIQEINLSDFFLNSRSLHVSARSLETAQEAVNRLAELASSTATAIVHTVLEAHNPSSKQT